MVATPPGTHPVPTIDLAASDAPRRLDEAARTVGFFQVIGHGVDPALTTAVLDAMDSFFGLPLETKRAYPPPSPDVNTGYSAVGAEALASSLGVAAPPDLFEAFNVGAEDVDHADPAVAAEAHRIFAPNLWPAEVPELRTACTAYLAAVRTAADRVTATCARALDLPPDFFRAFTTHSTDTLRMNWYRRAAGSPPPLAGQQRMGAHTDYGIVTLLHADAVPGLEIVGPDGTWVGVVPDAGAYVVNIGDLLAQWTNDRWRSTLHRVVPPPADADGAALRRSIAFFHDGDYDATIACLPTCCSADDPPRYAPVRALDHLLNKLVGGRTREPAAATAHIGDRLDAASR